MRGTYLHTRKGGDRVCYDGVPDEASWAVDLYEFSPRALSALKDENEGDRLDRFLVVKGRMS